MPTDDPALTRLRVALSDNFSRFRNEIAPYNFLPVTESVLQEDEFRNVIMPIGDPTTAPHLRELRYSIHAAVEADKDRIAWATRKVQRVWFMAVIASGFAVLIAFLGVFAAYIAVAYVLVVLVSSESSRILTFVSESAAEPQRIVDIGWAALGILGVGFTLYWIPKRIFRWAGGRWRDREFAITDQVRPIVRVAINEFVNMRHPTRLLVENAPGLAESGIPGQFVYRHQFEHVDLLTERLGASTIAVSGPRGAGKTTLLRRIGMQGSTTAPSGLRIVVAAPTTYEPRDFLVHLYLRLCNAVLDKTGAHRYVRKWVQISVVSLRTIARVAIVLAMIGILLSLSPIAAGVDDSGSGPGVEAITGIATAVSELGIPIPSTVQPALLAIVGLSLLYWLVGRLFRSKRVARSGIGIAARAEDERRRLSFVRTVVAERSNSLGRWGLGITRRSASQLAEQPLSLPELVDSYRSFVSHVTNWLRHEEGRHAQLIVGIDEVDRIVDSDDAERFINGIKPIFGIPGASYIVTLSEEALARLEYRRIYARTAIDSAFDEIVRLERLTLSESIKLMRGRIIGLPDIFIALGHCLSGGLPRDLIRSVRSMVDLRTRLHTSRFGHLLPIKLSTEIEAFKQTTIGGLAGNQQVNAQIITLLADPAWPPRTSLDRWWWDSESVLSASVVDLGSLTASDCQVPEPIKELVAALYFVATVNDVFVCIMRTSAEATLGEVLRKPRDVGVFEQLARIRGLIPTSASLAYQELCTLRTGLSLPVDPSLSRV